MFVKKVLFSKKMILFLFFIIFFGGCCICFRGDFIPAIGRITQNSKEVQSGVNKDSLTVSSSYNESGESLVNQILGEGLTATNISKKGTIYSFSNGIKDIGIDSGIVLDTSGKVSSTKEDADLKKLMEYSYGGDTSSIEFTMTATGTLLNFNYVFLSTEFDQPAKYNDVFGLFVSVNGGAYENIATIMREDGKKVPVNISNLKGGLSGHELSGKPIAMHSYSLFTAKNVNIGSGTNGVSNVFNAQKQVQVGDTVKIKFVIADVSDRKYDSYVMIESSSLSFEKPVAQVHYKNETLSNLEARVAYKVLVDEHLYEFVSQADGQIPLVGVDANHQDYDFINKEIQVIKKGYGSIPDSEPQKLIVDDRPDAPSDMYIKDIEVTKSSLKIVAKKDQQYSLNGKDWYDANSLGYVVFDELKSTDVTIYTRYAATESTFASKSSKGSRVVLQDSAKNLVSQLSNYEGVYDGKFHYAFVSGLEDATITYSEKFDGDYSTDFIKFKNVGVYKIHYCISKDGYSPFYGELEVIIKQKKITPRIKLLSSSYSYTGDLILPDVEVYDDEMLISDSEYEITYSDNIDVGTAKISITNRDGGNYILNDTSTTFLIEQKELENLRVVLDQEEYIYDGNEKRPVVTVYDGNIIIPDDKYIVTYSNNVNASTLEKSAHISITSLDDSNYKFNIDKTFIIHKLSLDPFIAILDKNIIYSGSEQCPKILLKDKLGNVVAEDEYKITYKNNVHVGDAEIFVESKKDSNYDFSTFVTFVISPKKIDSSSISLQDKTFVYDGNEKKPSVIIRDGEHTLSNDEYDVFYTNNIYVGEGIVTVKSKADSNYSFAESLSFKILPKKLEYPTVLLDNEIFEYNGNVFTPSVVIKDFDTVIDPLEYNVTYQDNIEVGTAKVFVESKKGSNYEFTTSKSFVIKKVGSIGKIEQPSNFGSAKLIDNSDELVDKILLTDEEKNLRARGKDVLVYIKVKDISDTIPLEDKATLNDSLLDNQKIGMYLDVSLFKRQDGVEERQITKTDGKVKIGIEMPEEIVVHDKNIKRNYYIMRMHEGVIDFLELELKDNLLLFETDLFSTYALVYADEVISKEESPSSIASVSKTINPVTFDSTITYILLSIISGVILLVRGVHIFQKNK